MMMFLRCAACQDRFAKKPAPPAPPQARPSLAAPPTAAALLHTDEPEKLIDTVANVTDPLAEKERAFVDAVVEEPEPAKDDEAKAPRDAADRPLPQLPQAALPTSEHIDEFGFEEYGESDDDRL